MTTHIKIPCSSANIGPGFDVIGLALNLYLELEVTVTKKEKSEHSLNCKITYEGVGAEDVPLAAQDNLITRTAVYVLRCHGVRDFPSETHVHVKNPIPLGRGLGSSAAAIVGGVYLANEVGNLGLSRARMLDYCLMEERHPDNVAAALYGGFVGTYLNELSPEDTERLEIPLSEVLPQPAGGVDTGLRPPEPPLNIGHYTKFAWSPAIKCICVIPQFEVSTAKARAVLPESYSRKDAIFNMQRLAVLTTALGQATPDPDIIQLGERSVFDSRAFLNPDHTFMRKMPTSFPSRLSTWFFFVYELVKRTSDGRNSMISFIQTCCNNNQRDGNFNRGRRMTFL
jgi:homoserine kinase